MFMEAIERYGNSGHMDESHVYPQSMRFDIGPILNSMRFIVPRRCGKPGLVLYKIAQFEGRRRHGSDT